MASETKTPAQLGYRMRAEWEPHAATWLSWPRREGISFPDSFDRVLRHCARWSKRWSNRNPYASTFVTAARSRSARQSSNALPQECITYYEIPTNEPWCRDHGPIFLTRDVDPKLAIVDWDYNAWETSIRRLISMKSLPTQCRGHPEGPVFIHG